MEDRHSGRFQKILPLETLEALKAPNAHVVCALDEWCRQGQFLQIVRSLCIRMILGSIQEGPRKLLGDKSELHRKFLGVPRRSK